MKGKAARPAGWGWWGAQRQTGSRLKTPSASSPPPA